MATTEATADVKSEVVPLRPKQALLLALLEADPRLARDTQRDRLMLLAGMFDRYIGPTKMGRLLVGLRSLHAAGKLDTHVFDYIGNDDPPLATADAVIARLAQQAWSEQTAVGVDRRRVKALRLLGCIVKRTTFVENSAAA
ncbi:hypothetical protein [Xanthomonas sp. NCPPB 2632]|uniref:hypothetical protein n=1 Tax=Xanthomonas sp. NCPPB 2632 TaxID=3240912 RepID=UPI003513F9C4